MTFLLHILAAAVIGYVLGKIFREFKAIRSSQKEMHHKLNLIIAGQNPVEPAASIELMFVEPDGSLKKESPMNLKKEKLREFVLVAKTAHGKVTRVDGEPTISLPDGVTIVEQDGKKYLAVSDDLAEGPLDAPVVIDADGDLGDGVKPLHFEDAVNVVAADAATLEIQLGEEIDAP